MFYHLDIGYNKELIIHIIFHDLNIGFTNAPNGRSVLKINKTQLQLLGHNGSEKSRKLTVEVAIFKFQCFLLLNTMNFFLINYNFKLWSVK